MLPGWWNAGWQMVEDGERRIGLETNARLYCQRFQRAYVRIGETDNVWHAQIAKDFCRERLPGTT
jgi:hypothetical protein